MDDLRHDPEEEQATEETQDGGACEPEGCEEETDDKDKGKKKQGKAPATNPAPAAPAKTAPAATTPAPMYTYPFNVRYAAEILDLFGFADGHAYTAEEIRDVLIQNGYTEFSDIEPAFHLSTATNTVVITIKGSKKGTAVAVGIKLPRSALARIELIFLGTYRRHGTEDRVLIYKDERGNLMVDQPAMHRRPGSVTCDVELTIEHDGRLWDLAFDLHSHHTMGAFWSSTDDENERIRGPIFGVCSWKERWPPAWLFRRFTGQGFEDMPIKAVVADG